MYTTPHRSERVSDAHLEQSNEQCRILFCILLVCYHTATALGLPALLRCSKTLINDTLTNKA